MTLPRIRGAAARIASRPDVESITALISACELNDNGMREVHPIDVEEAFDLAAEDADVIAVEAGPELVAWASLQGDRVEADVHPDWRGKGIGSALLAWSESRARAAGHARVRQVVTDSDTAAGLLFAGAGYRMQHTSWVLQMQLGVAPPAVDLPPEIEIRPYRPDDAEAAYRIIEDAFNEWPDRQPADFASWSARTIAHAAAAPSLSRLAYDGPEPVGVVLCMDYPGEEEGWIGQVATKATHRHRGIGRALLQSAFAAFHAGGRRSVGLSTNSQSGARTLYEKIGMRVRRSYTAWVKDLGESGAS